MEVARLGDDEAYAMFLGLRYESNDGKPFCPWCGGLTIHTYKTRRIFKCKECEKQFSPTSGTPFAHHKMSMRDILMAIAIFVNSVKGHAALQMSRELKCSYKTAFVLEHKLREVIGTLQADHMLNGIVEIDGMAVGGHIKKANLVKDRIDLRIHNPKRQYVVTMRERRPGGRSVCYVFQHEADAIPAILATVHESAKIRVDDAGHWNVLLSQFDDVKFVNHSKEGYSVNGVHTNWVESFNSRMRHADRSVHHHVAGPYLRSYANEIAWREDHRRVSNGTQFTLLLKGAARHPVSRKWKGYWQRHLNVAGAA
jgi:transposase-like protein